jgi:hypothetical protein
MRMTHVQCIRATIRDLWRDGQICDARRLSRVRHTVRLDRYGWPIMTPPIN